MEGLDAKRILARLQLEGEEFLLTSLFIELAGIPKRRNGDMCRLEPRRPAPHAMRKSRSGRKSAAMRGHCGTDRVLDPDGRNSLGGARIPAVAACPLADVIPKPPAALGRVGGDHRPVAAMAEQKSGQQRVLLGPDRVRALALPGPKLSVHGFPERRRDDCR